MVVVNIEVPLLYIFNIIHYYKFGKIQVAVASSFFGTSLERNGYEVAKKYILEVQHGFFL